MAKTPRVSICVPNLNMLPFLPERFESFFQQTFQDWEIFVFDGYSDDGAWEYLESLASRDKRIRLAQGPRKGPYPAWNECVKQTTGEYVYIATSDDSMAPDCLEKLVAALDGNPACELAHCPLRVIDADGQPKNAGMWPDVTVFARGLPGLEKRAHIRHAPYDGLIHLTGLHAYLSIAQLLIRRTLFAKIGVFPNQWGNVSDFNWEMKAGLVANTVHVPDTWASWRIHDKQATVTQNFRSRDRDQKVEAMIADALDCCRPYLSSKVAESRWFKTTRSLRDYYSYLGHGRSLADRRIHQLKQLMGGPREVRDELLRFFSRKEKWPRPVPGEIKRWLEAEGLGPVITEKPV